LVRIKINDILARELSTPTDEEKSAGLQVDIKLHGWKLHRFHLQADTSYNK